MGDPREDTCAACGKPIKVSDKRRRNCKSGMFFCSHGCHSAAQRLDSTHVLPLPAHYGTAKKPPKVRFKPHPGMTRDELFVAYKQRHLEHHWGSARAVITSRARAAYIASGNPLRCAVCGYDTAVDICHIVGVMEVPGSTTLEEINKLSNLVALCKNHHNELDLGLRQSLNPRTWDRFLVDTDLEI
mgnify:CR=1 FL=1